MIKNILQSYLGLQNSKLNFPILINSYGRSGSTVLTKSIINSTVHSNFNWIKVIASRAISQSMWDLNNAQLKRGIVYKTHDYPPDTIINKDIRMLYTFANPINVVLSLLRLYEKRGDQWMRTHFSHLRASYKNFHNIIYEDQLKLEIHLSSWLKEERFPIAFIKYETMWEHQDDISEFLGFPIELPQFKERKANNSSEENNKLKKELTSTYETLAQKVNLLDDFFIHNNIS